MSWLRRKQNGKKASGTRVFFATDIHGSEVCFRKFLNSRTFYEVDVLILGGDIIGKSLIPIVKDPAGWQATWRGRQLADLDKPAREELQAAIRRAGDYYVVGTADELRVLDDPAELDRVFRRVAYQSIADWVTLAHERLRGTGVRCFVAPGNDDFLEIDAALHGSEEVVFAENRVLPMSDQHDVLTTGYSNPTPWHTERELPEPDLRARLDALARQTSSMTDAVAVIHPPPRDCGLDLAPKLTDDLAVERHGGTVTMAPVGSTAVLEFINEWQPLLGLHGHVHESRASCHLGRTLCVNPGSEYSDGILSGSLIELGSERVISHQFVSG